MVRCMECGGYRVHYIEFKTELTKPVYFYPKNNYVSEMDMEDLPECLQGHYCEECGILVSVDE